MTDEFTVDSLPADEVRTPREVALRALALFAAVAAAIGAPRDEIVPWLHEHGLWRELTPSETEFLSAEVVDKKSEINFGWQSECLMVLLWALGKVSDFPGPGQQCDTAGFQRILPPYADIEVAEFLKTAALLDDDILLAKCEEVLDQHWQARDAALQGRPAPGGINIEIVQERHHAINWVTGYDGLPWDEVTTDT